MGLRGWVKRLERAARGELIEIPQPDGSVKRFPKGGLAPAFLDAFARAVGRSEGPPHPLCEAARSSPDPVWRDSLYASERGQPVEDLSE